MRRKLWMLLGLGLVSLPLAAQDPSLPIRRLPDGKPNISGVYSSPSFENKSTLGVPPPLNVPMFGTRMLDPERYRDLIRPGADKLYDRPVTGDLRKDDPFSLCLPYGFPDSALASPYAQKIVQAPGNITRCTCLH